MNDDSGVLAILVAMAWFGAGGFAVVTALRHRTYVESLPPSPGNSNIKRENTTWLVVGVVMIVIGAWHTYRLTF